MKRFLLIALLFAVATGLSLSTTYPASGQYAASSVSNQQMAYDTFNGPWIDPQKWLALPRTDPCRDSTNSMECIREIQGGKLRLLVKSYGARDTNDGGQWGSATLVSATQAHRSMTVDVVVKNATAADCASTGGRSQVQAQFSVAFFNTGTKDDAGDNVNAYMLIQSIPGSPGVLWAYAIYEHHGVWSTGSNGMTVPVGTPVRGALVWDQPSSKFTATLTNLQSGQQVTSDMPYAESVMAPPYVWSLPILSVVASPSNCVAGPTSASVEATFDNVVIDR